MCFINSITRETRHPNHSIANQPDTMSLHLLRFDCTHPILHPSCMLHNAATLICITSHQSFDCTRLLSLSVSLHQSNTHSSTVSRQLQAIDVSKLSTLSLTLASCETFSFSQRTLVGTIRGTDRCVHHQESRLLSICALSHQQAALRCTHTTFSRTSSLLQSHRLVVVAHHTVIC